MNTEKASVNCYAHGARYYDPQLARWHAPDPLSELYASSSPYGYVINNPINFVDPDGMRRDPLPWGQEYNTRFLTDGERRLRADADSWNNVGRFMSDPGPGAPITVDGETYTPYQDPITGSYYYDKEHQAYSEPYYSNEYVNGYSHDFYGNPGDMTSANYQKAGVVYHSAYTERIYFDPSTPNYTDRFGALDVIGFAFDAVGAAAGMTANITYKNARIINGIKVTGEEITKINTKLWTKAAVRTNLIGATVGAIDCTAQGVSDFKSGNTGLATFEFSKAASYTAGIVLIAISPFTAGSTAVIGGYIIAGTATVDIAGDVGFYLYGRNRK